jgi:hypothetical protein
MNGIEWALVVTVFSTFYVYTAFLALCTVQRMRAAKVWMPWEMKVLAIFILVTGWPADVIFNITRGSFVYRELPWRVLTGEFTFSSRTKRMMRAGGKSRERATPWAFLLNAGDEGHITW